MLKWLRRLLPSRPTERRRPARVLRLEVPAAIVEASRAETRHFPNDETMFLWTGTCRGDRCVVRTLVTPEVSRSEGRVKISREAMKRAGRAMRSRGELLLLQIHTHPDRVAFSWIDEREAADQGAGALAMVVHFYGSTDWSPTADTVIYERDAVGSWAPWRGVAVNR